MFTSREFREAAGEAAGLANRARDRMRSHQIDAEKYTKLKQWSSARESWEKADRAKQEAERLEARARQHAYTAIDLGRYG